ncbi:MULTISPECIES: PID-CTERM protein-sorting domain-containing protein [unclassified Hymenobacter]|nr:MULTISPECIES: hypothetical protein [unclassified Hymenobacter]
MSWFSFALRAVVLGSLLVAGRAATAQPGNGGTTGGPGAPAAPTAVPLDGGAGLLLASSLAYGLRRLRRPRS